MLPTFGVKMNPDAFSAGFDIEKCRLNYSKLHDELYFAFKSFEFEDATGVKHGLFNITAALRGMSAASRRCDLNAVGNKLQEAGDDIATVVTDEVTANTEGGLTEVLVNGHNLTQHLQAATRKWFRKDYAACGKDIAAMVVTLV